MEIKEIESLAARFRKAIEDAFRSGAFGRANPFSRFPNGCCDDVCDLFGQLLVEKGIIVWKIFATYRYDNWENKYSHVWLQLEDGVIIDLTGDQYKNNSLMLNYDIPCYVGEIDSLHRLLQEGDVRSEPFYGIDCYSESARHRLWELYKIVMEFFR